MPQDAPSTHPQHAHLDRVSLVILAVVASGVALQSLAPILAPPAMALFLAVVIDGFARMIRTRTPVTSHRLAMLVAILLSLAMFGVSVFVVAENATSFIGRLTEYGPRLDHRIERISAALKLNVAPTLDQIIARLNLTSYLDDVARGFQSFASNALLILIYLGFILASRRSVERKIVSLTSNRAERARSVETFNRIRDGIEQYLWVQTVTGLIIAGACWLTMVAVGLDNASFWAFFIFIAAYIPIVGAAVGIAAPPLFALIQFETLWQASVLLAVLWTIYFVVGNVILPRMQGDSLNIDPVVLLLALAYWGAIWGAAGMFLSTPLTTVLMVICAQFDRSRWVAVLLSANGDPEGLRSRKSPGSPDDRPPTPRRRRVTQP